MCSFSSLQQKPELNCLIFNWSRVSQFSPTGERKKKKKKNNSTTGRCATRERPPFGAASLASLSPFFERKVFSKGAARELRTIFVVAIPFLLVVVDRNPFSLKQASSSPVDHRTKVKHGEEEEI